MTLGEKDNSEKYEHFNEADFFLFFSTKKEKEERGSHQDTPARCVKAA
jgi:hypothetical protein